MDFSSMRRRICEQGYGSLEAFEEDFNLIISNCLLYNAKDTFFYKAAQRMQDHGGAILRRARKEAARIGFDWASGLHLAQSPAPEPAPAFSWEDGESSSGSPSSLSSPDHVLCFSSVDRLLSPAYRQATPLEEQLEELLEKLDLSAAMKHSPSRSKRLKLLKKSIMEVRSELSLRKSFPPAPPSSPRPPAPPPSLTPPLIQLRPPTEEPLAPPMLELLTSLSQIDVPSESPSAPRPDVDAVSPTSAPADAPDGVPDSPLLNGELYAEASATCSQRTSALFRKAKSSSPQKASRSQDAAAAPPQPLGAKTFLSVVIPRLETLLLPRKRRRSIDGQREEEEPIKRLGTGSPSDSSAGLCGFDLNHFLFLQESPTV